MKVNFNISPASYGNGSIVDAMKNKNWAFEIEFSDPSTKFRTIITLEQASELKDDINKAFKAYEQASELNVTII